MKWTKSKSIAAMLVVTMLIAPMAFLSVWVGDPRPVQAQTSTGVTSYRIPQELSVVSVDSSGTTFTLVTGVVGQRIQVWDGVFTTNLTGSTATLQILSGATELTGAMNTNAFTWDAPVGMPGQWFAFPKFVTNSGDNLVITLGATGQLSGQIKYTQQ